MNVKQEVSTLKKEVKTRTMGYIVAAFGLVAGLAWNEAIKSLIESLFPLSRNSISAKFVYALVLTFVLIIISIYLAKLFNRNTSGAER